MTEVNLLKEAFITNEPVPSGTLREVTSEEMLYLITDSASVSVSGNIVNLLIDLGAQKSTKRLEYYVSPTTTSGLTIKYGRDESELITGALTTVSGRIEVYPTISGYDYPRYFTLTHDAEVNSLVISSLSVINEDSEINFGTDGNTYIKSLTGLPTGGTSAVHEVPVKNDGTIPSDIYVSVDSAFINIEVLKSFQIAPTESGTFQAYNEALTMPDVIPWQWGIFDNTTVSEDNKLKIIDDSPDYNFSVGDVIGITLETATNLTHTDRAYDIYNNESIVRINSDHSFTFVDPIRNIKINSITPPYSVVGVEEQQYTHPTWDGGDRIFFINGKDTQEIQQYNISSNTFSVFTTTSFYNRLSRATVVYDGYLYVVGAISSAGSANSVGDQFWRIRLSDKVEQQLTDLPITPDSSIGPKICALDGYIYYYNGTTGSTIEFWRYSIDNNMWEQLPDFSTELPLDLSANETNKQVWVTRNQTNRDPVVVYNVATAAWIEDALNIVYNPDAGGLGVRDAIYYYTDSITTKALVLGGIKDPNMGVTTSGTWVSPVYRLNTEEELSRVLFELQESEGVELKFDESLGADNYQIRSSNDSPAAQNTHQFFNEGIDTDEFVRQILSEDTIISASGYRLTFGHEAAANDYNAGYVYFGYPLNTVNTMQYKFWWNPSTDKKDNSDIKSKFYIVPFIDVLGEGTVVPRNLETLDRYGDDYIYISLGADTDTNGSFSEINFFNGSSIATYSIDARAGTDYEVVLMVDWTTGDYKLYFDTALVGTGTIPAVRLTALKPQHSYEFFSTGEQTDFDESFRYLTINREGLEVVSDTLLATPVHKEDPLFGENGSLEWQPITVNSPLIPKGVYTQFRVTFRGSGFNNTPVINKILFPPVIKLENVAVGETQSVYARYIFPPANDMSTNTVYIKAWTFTDKL